MGDRELLERERGADGIRALPARLLRAHKTGCSSIDDLTLEECISDNRAGPGESCMPPLEFIERYLTLPS